MTVVGRPSKSLPKFQLGPSTLYLLLSPSTRTICQTSSLPLMVSQSAPSITTNSVGLTNVVEFRALLSLSLVPSLKGYNEQFLIWDWEFKALIRESSRWVTQNETIKTLYTYRPSSGVTWNWENPTFFGARLIKKVGKGDCQNLSQTLNNERERERGYWDHPQTQKA